MSVDNFSREELYELWKKEESTDLLVVVDGKEFKCHTAVLCACSDFFKAMMEAKMKESQERVVHLGDISSEIFSTILESMYTEKNNLTNENVVDMWYASHQLQIKHVMQQCEKFVTGEYLTVETCVPLYCHAKQLAATTILNRALTYVFDNFESLVKTDSYLGASYDTILQIVKSEDLKIESEDSVIEFILKWVCHAPQGTHAQHKSHVSEEHDQNIKPGGHAHKTRAKRSGEGCGGEEGGNEGEKIDEKKNKTNTFNRSTMSLDVIPDIRDSPSTSHSQEENRPERVKDSEEQATERKDTLRETDVKPQKYPRATYLQKLLRSSRICLAGSDVLENLLKHELVEREKELYKYVFDSLLYKLDVGRRHGSWPEAAYCRRSSGKKHVMVFVESNSNNVMEYDLDECYTTKWTTIRSEEAVVDVNKSITVFDNQLLVWPFVPERDIKLFCLPWRTLKISLPDNLGGAPISRCFLAHGNGIYCQHELKCEIPVPGKSIYYNKVYKTEYRYHLTYTNMVMFAGNQPYFEHVKEVTDMTTIRSAIPFGQYIIDFCDLEIHVIDTKSRNHIKLRSIDGPMENIISFNDHDNTYILQRNGEMWKILLADSAEKVKFESVDKVWDFDWEIYGGIFYKGKLFIFGDAYGFQGEIKTRQTSVPGVFDNIQYVFIKSCTKCVPLVI